MFEHQLLPKIDIPSVFIDGKKYYETPAGRLRSVTSILSEEPKEALEKWKKRVGPDEAIKISGKASRRGTRLHKIMEDYISNKENFLSGAMPDIKALFLSIKGIVDKHITKIFGYEYPLYSEQLMAAGTTDLLCEYSNKFTIVDYKTANRYKKEEWMENYFLQLTTYSIMVEERYNIEVEQIAVIVAVDHDTPQVIIRKPSMYRKHVIELFNKYKNL